MKKLIALLLALMLSLCVFTACSPDDGPDDGGFVPGGGGTTDPILPDGSDNAASDQNWDLLG